MKNPLKVIWSVLGFMCLGLGTMGIVLPGIFINTGRGFSIFFYI